MRPRWVACALVAVTVALALRAAWLSDDAYITFRTVDNLTSGLGATWNPGERVQAYTHPLWMLLLALAHLVTDEIYFTSLALSLALSALAVWLVAARVARSTAGAVVAVATLALSKAFCDYSTSGLEAPLAHVLIALFALVWLNGGGAFRLALVAGLLFTTRPDAVPLMLPALALGLWRERASWRAALVGFLPFLTWEVFAIFYYGFPFPNTAYAKLSTGLPRGELIAQGLAYLGNSLRLDPLTLVALAGGVAAALWSGRRAERVLMAGALLHVAYVVWIGGDFMSGRFLTFPLLLAAVALARVDWAPKPAVAAATMALVLGLANPLSPIRAPTAYFVDVGNRHDVIEDNGISDERGYWFFYTGLFAPSRADPAEHHVTRGHPFGERLRTEAPLVRVVDGMGFPGFFGGPEVHLVDPMGLTDALLARLPIYKGGRVLDPSNAFRDRAWRIGHFKRPLPEGYLESLEAGENRLADPVLAAFYDDLALVTRGDLFRANRTATILRLNFVGR